MAKKSGFPFAGPDVGPKKLVFESRAAGRRFYLDGPDAGSKMVLREGRSALARMSIIDCRTGRVIIDDHVLPREPVVDYLTRFSGIVEEHLNVNSSPHHLITTRNAYLKLRLLLERYVSNE